MSFIVVVSLQCKIRTFRKWSLHIFCWFGRTPQGYRYIKTNMMHYFSGKEISINGEKKLKVLYSIGYFKGEGGGHWT